ncbi:MAG: GPR endopeptidase [Oscillospiraceae bacterium]|nr:GPR endopeptidase [Oscillospiraceae bacterium]
MLQKRTDLALEARELWTQEQGGAEPEGVEMDRSLCHGCPVTTLRITGPQGAQAIGKPEGSYVTIDLSDLKHRQKGVFLRSVQAVRDQLQKLLPEGLEQGIFVVGLGNRAITPDNIGPAAVDHVLATRHLVEQLPEYFRSFRPVSALAAGVLASTGVESGELALAVAQRIHPACVIAIDALASRALSRICTTVQLTDTGISPGSGVGNSRAPLNRKTMSVPVLALGVPTVVDVATLCADVLEEAGQAHLDPKSLKGAGTQLMVTPRDIDQSAADMAKVIGFAINLALHENLSMEELELLLS